MRLRDREVPMDPRAERDLETVDRALAGQPVAGTPGASGGGDLAELALLLRDERPETEPRWAARLDDSAAAGFPRGGGGWGGVKSRFGGGKWMVPAGAVASLAILVLVVSKANDGGFDQAGTGADSVASAPESTTTSSDAAAEGVTDAQRNSLAPTVAFDRSTGAIAPGTDARKVERNTQLALSAQPEDVRGVSDEVISITRSLGGIVATSQVSESPDGANATLELTIPTRNLDAAVDRMTDLADVDSLNEASTDITKPFVSAQDRVHDAEAERRQLLKALGNATTDAEAEALTIRIADARREISRAEASFERIARKARLSSLSVTVTSNPNASADRTLGDWFDDAVDVLKAIAGILLIAAAILIPFGLIAAIVAWVISRVRRHRRERSLD
jgi:hypothetical protein